MRVVLDTNLVVRAARPGAGLARAILLETLSDRHTLILSNSLYFEAHKVLYYDSVRQMHGLDDAGIAKFLQALVEGSFHVIPSPVQVAPLVADDPTDDHVVLTAIAGRADLLGTNNRHFFAPTVTALAATHGIQIVRDVQLLAELTAI